MRAAERKCLCDAQDFPYISAGSADPDIKVWVERAQSAMKMASHQEVIFHIVVVKIPSTTQGYVVMSTMVQSTYTHTLLVFPLTALF